MTIVISIIHLQIFKWMSMIFRKQTQYLGVYRACMLPSACLRFAGRCPSKDWSCHRYHQRWHQKAFFFSWKRNWNRRFRLWDRVNEHWYIAKWPSWGSREVRNCMQKITTKKIRGVFENTKRLRRSPTMETPLHQSNLDNSRGGWLIKWSFRLAGLSGW